MNQRKRWPSSRRTEIAYENCLCGIRRPFSVVDRCVLFDIETKFEIAFGKRVVASFILLYGVLPLCEGLMPANDGREKGLKPRIEVEYGFLVERHCWEKKTDCRLKYIETRRRHHLASAIITHPRSWPRDVHPLVPRSSSKAQPMDPKRSLVDPELNPTKPTKSPTKKLLQYVVSLGLLWYILHRSWLFLLALNSTNDWAIDAFAPKERGPSNSQLAENFFL
jgi:hypothetical protein